MFRILCQVARALSGGRRSIGPVAASAFLARVVALGSVALLCGCGASPPGDSGESASEIAQPLNDAFLTEPIITRGQVAVASDRIFTIWGGSTANGSEIVGQLFDASTLQPLSASRVYTSSSEPKWGPKVAVSNHGFFITYESLFSTTDHDIHGIMVGLDGAPTSGVIGVNTSTRYESGPSVTWAPGQSKWLVVYTQADDSTVNPPSPQRLLANYITTAGAVGAPITIRTPPAMTPVGGALVAANLNTVTIAWGENNQVVRAAMAPDATNSLGAPQVVDSGSLRSIALNPNTGRFAIGYFVQNSSGMFTKMVTFPTGCTSSACASPSQTTFSTGPTVTKSLWPYVAPLGNGFQSSFGVEGSPVPNGMNIVTFATDDNGNNIGAARLDGAPSCVPGSGLRNAVAAASDPSASFSVTLLAPGCPGVVHIYGEKLLPPVGAQPPATSRFAVADALHPTYVQNFDAGDNRVFQADGNWSGVDYKAECASKDYISGIAVTSIGMRPDLRGHAALCTQDQTRMIFAPLRTTHSLTGADDRADTSTGDWDKGFVKAECGSAEAVVGVSQSSDGALNMSRILCAPMDLFRVNTASCTPLPFSSTSDNRRNTATGDWAMGYSKNECPDRQILKGVSRKSTGEIHAILCCPSTI